jgi:NitT/TauT family transport system substrate-binding protein
MHRMGKTLAAALLLAAAPLWAAPKQTAKPAAKSVILRFVTDRMAQGEQGGYYEAVAMGIYARRGLNVKILPGGPTVNVPRLLASGAADFGIAANGFVALNMVRDGIAAKAVMATFQKDPRVLLTHPHSAMQSLAALRGKPILIADTSLSALWPWLRAKHGFSDSQLRKYTFNPAPDLAPFIANKNAVQDGELLREPYAAERQGHFQPRIFLLADHGYPGYANIVLAAQRWIAKDPKAVQAFVDATRDGWYYYLNGDPRPANTLIKRDNPGLSDGALAQAIAKMKAYHLVFGSNHLGVGAMQQSRWRIFFDTMAGLGLFPKTLDYKKAFDTHFIDNAPQNFE